MSQPDPAFRQLQKFIGEATARNPRKKGSKAESANELTGRIVKHIRANGGFATRLQSTGLFRDDLKKWVSSQQVSGLPDVLAVFVGRPIFVEVKVGRDVLSEPQKRRIADLEEAGAWVYVAHNFEGFEAWFVELTSPPF